MLLSPAEMMAQQGSSPNWLLARAGIMTTTTTIEAMAFRANFQLRIDDGQFIVYSYGRVSTCCAWFWRLRVAAALCLSSAF
jgi:hypothetical protein